MLKKSNCKFKDIPQPVDLIAMISKLEIRQNGYTCATFDIKVSRDGEVLNQVKVPFTFVRTENPMETAYNTAKGMKVEMVWDEETHQEVEKEVPNVFYGWEDDIKYYED